MPVRNLFVWDPPCRFPPDRASDEFFGCRVDCSEVAGLRRAKIQAVNQLYRNRIHLLMHSARLSLGLDVVSFDRLILGPGRNGVAPADCSQIRLDALTGNPTAYNLKLCFWSVRGEDWTSSNRGVPLL